MNPMPGTFFCAVQDFCPRYPFFISLLAAADRVGAIDFPCVCVAICRRFVVHAYLY
jgi:hypothetical protein